MADSKWGRWYVQPSEPDGPEVQADDMWVNTTTGEQFRFTGGAWMPATQTASAAEQHIKDLESKIKDLESRLPPEPKK